MLGTNILLPPKTYKHSGDIGDLIYSLCVLKYYGKGLLYLHNVDLGRKIDGSRSGFTEDTINFLRPLLACQAYVEDIKIWDNEEVKYDLDNIRSMAIDYCRINICEMYLRIFGVPAPVSRIQWLKAESKKVQPVVFARSLRYHNPQMNWHELAANHAKDAIFVGHKHEHATFVAVFGEVEFYPVKDALELASVIAGAELFVGNQSAPMAIAIALADPKQKIIQEVCSSCSNCIFPRQNITYVSDKHVKTLRRDGKESRYRAV